MTGDKLVADLQRIAATEVNYYDMDEIDVIDMLTLETAHPEATPEQLQLAVRRAEFQLRRRIADVEGWWSDFTYDITDHRWQKLERMKVHAWLLTAVEPNTCT